MEEAAVWAGVVLLTAAALIWRVDRFLHAYLRTTAQIRHEVDKASELSMAERRLALQIDEATAAEQTDLKRAELRRQTAEANCAAALVEDLKDDRLAAERMIAGAAAQAKVALSEEFARAEHTAGLERQGAGSFGSVMDQYARYLEVADDHGESTVNFEAFVRLVQSGRL